MPDNDDPRFGTYSDRGVVGVGLPDAVPDQTSAGSNADRLTVDPGAPQPSLFPFRQGIDFDLGGIGFPLRYSPKLIRRFNLDLSTARLFVRFNTSGTLFWVPDGSIETAVFEVTFDSLDNDAIPFKPGAFISGIPFGRFWISNAAQAGESVAFITSIDSPADRIDVR